MAWLSERCILAPLNETTRTINATLVAQLSGESVKCRSLDSLRCKKIFEAGVLRLKENSPAGGVGVCPPDADETFKILLHKINGNFPF